MYQIDKVRVLHQAQLRLMQSVLVMILSLVNSKK